MDNENDKYTISQILIRRLSEYAGIQNLICTFVLIIKLENHSYSAASNIKSTSQSKLTKNDHRSETKGEFANRQI